jgi:hypothetical protein
MHIEPSAAGRERLSPQSGQGAHQDDHLVGGEVAQPFVRLAGGRR